MAIIGCVVFICHLHIAQYVNQSLLTTVAHLLPLVTSPDTQGCCDITLAVNADNTICEHHFNKRKHIYSDTFTHSFSEVYSVNTCFS